MPPDVGNGSLGMAEEDMARHIAWDPGSAGVAIGLGELMNAPVIMSNFSRLVIDPNRGEDDPTLLMKLYDGTIIPANRHADAVEEFTQLAALMRGTVNGARNLYVAAQLCEINLKDDQRALELYRNAIEWYAGTELAERSASAVERLSAGDSEP